MALELSNGFDLLLNGEVICNLPPTLVNSSMGGTLEYTLDRAPLSTKIFAFGDTLPKAEALTLQGLLRYGDGREEDDYLSVMQTVANIRQAARVADYLYFGGIPFTPLQPGLGNVQNVPQGRPTLQNITVLLVPTQTVTAETVVGDIRAYLELLGSTDLGHGFSAVDYAVRGYASVQEGTFTIPVDDEHTFTFSTLEVQHGNF